MSLPPLHVVTDDRVLRRPDLVRAAGEVLGAGGARLALHLRGPRTSAAELHRLAGALLPVAREAGALLLVNDRVDLALTLPVDGVHLGERSLPAGVARALLGSCWIGRSVHGPAVDLGGGEAGADYLLVGTVFASSSHPGRAAAGAGRVRDLSAVAGLPVLAIGGVTPGRVAEVVRAGAWGVGVLSGVWSAAEPAGAVEGYLEALASAGRPPAGATSP